MKRRAGPLLLAATLLTAPSARAQTPQPLTSGVFGRYAGRVVKIQVIESRSAAKASLGSGFYVSAEGHVVTNYHVISELVLEPERYRAELIDAGGETFPLELLAIDVVHDLAVVRGDVRPAGHFTLGEVAVEQGDRLYSLGHPSDLGLSIVEGTYNGHLQHTLYPKIHFTGSINHGMSGGPTISADGRVVGINVSTAGNQLSFLVPVDRAAALVAKTTSPGRSPPTDFISEVARQIRDYQAEYLRDMFADRSPTVELGRYEVVTEPAPFFRCWGDSMREPLSPYETVNHYCSTDDVVFIAGDQSSGVVEIEHELIRTSSLNRWRFHSLYTAVFARDNTPAGVEEHVTSWRCTTRNVRNGTTPLRAVLCARAYRKLEGLYDAVLKVAVLGRKDSGLVSTLTLSGATWDNVTRLAGRYLERLTWR